MKTEITINVKLDTESAKIEALDMVEGIYNRTEIVEDEIDEPITIREAIRFITDELYQYI